MLEIAFQGGYSASILQLGMVFINLAPGFAREFPLFHLDCLSMFF
jgi:hypothetical protein